MRCDWHHSCALLVLCTVVRESCWIVYFFPKCFGVLGRHSPSFFQLNIWWLVLMHSSRKHCFPSWKNSNPNHNCMAFFDRIWCCVDCGQVLLKFWKTLSFTMNIFLHWYNSLFNSYVFVNHRKSLALFYILKLVSKELFNNFWHCLPIDVHLFYDVVHWNFRNTSNTLYYYHFGNADSLASKVIRSEPLWLLAVIFFFSQKLCLSGTCN